MTKLHNTQMSIQSLRHSKQTQRKLESNSRKLSSGSRITQASDDAAGLSIAAKLNSQNRSKDQANRNVNQAVSIVQVMDGVLNEMSSMVIRVRELAIQSASDTYSNQERTLMNMEASQLLQEIKRTSESTKYQDHYVFKGENKKLDIQVDTHNGSQDRLSLNLEEFAQNPLSLGINDVSLDTKLHAQLSLVKLDYAQKEISKSRAKVGAFMSRLETTSSKLGSDTTNGKAAHSKIKDADYANQTAKNVKDKLVQSAQTMVQAQINGSGSDYLKLLG